MPPMIAAELVDSPKEYTPEYCMAIRAACTAKLEQVDQKVEKLDSRIFSLLILGIGNLLAAIGGVLSIIVMQVTK